MPESRSEAETDEKGETPSKNIISVISQFADDNLTIVRVRTKWKQMAVATIEGDKTVHSNETAD